MMYSPKEPEIVRTLNTLYIEFHYRYKEDPNKGHIIIQSNTQICRDISVPRRIFLPELYTLNFAHIDHIRVLVNLLPTNVVFYIEHNETSDSFVLDWNDEVGHNY